VEIAGSEVSELCVLPLYSALPLVLQQKVFEPTGLRHPKGPSRKCIVRDKRKYYLSQVESLFIRKYKVILDVMKGKPSAKTIVDNEKHFLDNLTLDNISSNQIRSHLVHWKSLTFAQTRNE